MSDRVVLPSCTPLSKREAECNCSIPIFGWVILPHPRRALRIMSPKTAKGERSMTRMAECACGANQGQGGGEPIMVSVCSCTQCQMRTGSVVSFGAYFPKDSVQPVSGTGTFNSFVRPADSGAKLTFYFCPTCDSNIFWEGRYSFW